MAEIKKISVGGVTYDLKDEKARTIAENPMLPVTGILDAQGGTDVTSKATSHRGIFYAGNGVFKAKSINNDTDFHSTWDAYDYNNVHYPASDVYASRGGAFSNALYLMEGSLYRIQAGAMVQVIQGSAGEGGELGEDVSIVKSGTSYVFGNGAVVGQNAQLNGTLSTGAKVGAGAFIANNTYMGSGAEICSGVKIGTLADGHGGVYINSDKELSTVKEGDTFIGKNVTIEDNATISVEMQTDFDDKPTDEQGNYLLGNNTIIGWDSKLGEQVDLTTDGESLVFQVTGSSSKNKTYIGGRSLIGVNTKVNHNTNIGRDVTIGDQVEIGKQVYIEEGFSVDEGAITTTGGILNLTGKGLQSTIGGSVNIGDGVKLNISDNEYIIDDGNALDAKTKIFKGLYITRNNKGGITFDDIYSASNDIVLGGNSSISADTHIIGNEYALTFMLPGNETVVIGKGAYIGNKVYANNGVLTLGTGKLTLEDYHLKVGTGSLSWEDSGNNKVGYLGVQGTTLYCGKSDFEVQSLELGTGFLKKDHGKLEFVNGGEGEQALGVLAAKSVVLGTRSYPSGSTDGQITISNFKEQNGYSRLIFGSGIIQTTNNSDSSGVLRLEVIKDSATNTKFIKISGEGGNYVRIPLNNQTIGAVSDETISV